MTLAELLASLQETSRRGVERILARSAELKQVRRELDAALDHHAHALNAYERRYESRSVSIDLGEVRLKLERGVWESLTEREGRQAVLAFQSFDVGLLRALLERRPHLWRRFLKRLVTRFDLPEDEATWSGYVALAEKAPAHDWPVRGILERPHHWVEPEGPERLARRLRDFDIVDVRARLRDAGLRESQPLFGYVIAFWLDQQRDRSRSLSKDLRICREDPSLKELFLPRGEVRRVQARFVASLLKALHMGYVADEDFAPFEESLVGRGSKFGDPRSETAEGWSLVKRFEPAAFEQFFLRLIDEDLSFFFREAMDDRPRAEYWSRFRGSIRRTECVMAPGKYADLQQRKASLDPKVRPALQRVKRFRGGAVSAFCLWFERFVVVEFSESGNAAYVYERDWFTENLADKLNDFSSASSLRTPYYKDRLIHSAQNGVPIWQPRFDATLQYRGIHPDRLPPSASRAAADSRYGETMSRSPWGTSRTRHRSSRW